MHYINSGSPFKSKTKEIEEKSRKLKYHEDYRWWNKKTAVCFLVHKLCIWTKKIGFCSLALFHLLKHLILHSENFGDKNVCFYYNYMYFDIFKVKYQVYLLHISLWLLIMMIIVNSLQCWLFKLCENTCMSYSWIHVHAVDVLMK